MNKTKQQSLRGQLNVGGLFLRSKHQRFVVFGDHIIKYMQLSQQSLLLRTMCSLVLTMLRISF
jgi:hypothetical protein